MKNYDKKIRELVIERDKIDREILELERERNYEIYKLIDSLKGSFELATSENEKIKEDGITYLLKSAKEIIENKYKVF